MKVTHTTPYNNTIEITFRRSCPYVHYNGIGKAWPPTTDCEVLLNGDVVGKGTAVKHDKDKDNQMHGCKVAMKRAMSKAGLSKTNRIVLWKLFFARFFLEKTKGSI